MNPKIHLDIGFMEIKTSLTNKLKIESLSYEPMIKEGK